MRRKLDWWIVPLACLTLVLTVVSGVALYNAYTIARNEQRRTRDLRAAALGECRRVNVLRSQSNKNSIGVYNALSQARLSLILPGIQKGLPHAARVERRVTAALMQAEIAKLTITPLTDCSQAVPHPLTYVAPAAVPIQLTAAVPVSVPTTQRIPTVDEGPGVGRPTITFGDKNFPEQYVLGELYARALAHQGFHVILKGNIGPTEVTYPALIAGKIDVYPEYTGALLSVLEPQRPPGTDNTYQALKARVARDGNVLLVPTPFENSDAIGVLRTTAQALHLRTIADLKKWGQNATLSGAPEFLTRAEGLPGLKKAYGINPIPIPLSIGLVYEALNLGEITGGVVFTTDPQLASGQYRVLADPKHVFGFQHVAPVVRRDTALIEGPAFTRTMDRVSALLTIDRVRQMNAEVHAGIPPSLVAERFLRAHGL